MKKIAETIAREGLMGFYRRSKNRLYVTRLVMRAEIEELLQRADPKDYRIRRIDANVIREIRQTWPEEFTERKVDIFTKWLDLSETEGYAVLHPSGEIAGHLWISKRSRIGHVADLEMEIKEDEIYSVDAYVFEKYRRQGVMSAAYGLILAACRDEGYTKVIAHVADYNMPSRNMLRRLGFQMIGRHRSFRRKR